eukprot:TRINITY_DN106365_c0_g1_i1.p1 TRINITY_DN106365_c0_g1~~TRINITY_DN106365_c0_g1_i1.p1  ORF type:complete len:199 (-),score=94.64 TRINITY_DN106365_c0_g1_i1:80-676(-)
MVIAEVEGDLFVSKESLAHCVSRDLRLGKGIARLFRDKFGRIDALRKQDKAVGQVAWFKIGYFGSRHIYNLVTKERFFHKPTYDSLRRTLVELRRLMKEHGVAKVSMPKIGCGLDKLKWPRVRAMLDEIFGDDDVTVTVYVLPSKRSAGKKRPLHNAVDKKNTTAEEHQSQRRRLNKAPTDKEDDNDNDDERKESTTL